MTAAWPSVVQKYRRWMQTVEGIPLKSRDRWCQYSYIVSDNVIKLTNLALPLQVKAVEVRLVMLSVIHAQTEY